MTAQESQLLDNDVVAIDRLGQIYMALKRELSKVIVAPTGNRTRFYRCL